MKKILVTLSVLIITVFFAATTLAQSNTVKKSNKDYKTIEENYLKGLSSENQGLKISSAYFLGDMKSDKAVIPLMRMFRNEKNDGAKLVAAWSLLKIGDARGVFLVQRECEFGDCEGIKYMLFHLYRDYNLKAGGDVQIGDVTSKP